MKRIVNSIIFLLLTSTFVHLVSAQSWNAYLAYNNATIVAETPNHVFAIYDGSLLSYSPSDQEVVKYSFNEGLNDVNIQHMIYSPDADALMLVYENANIDIFAGKGNVYNLASIKNNTSLENKRINNLEIIGDKVYLSTGFGIVILDVKRKEIKDSYQSLRMNTKSICQWGNYMYIATDEGVWRANSSANLLDKENWERYTINLSAYNLSNSAIEKMLVFQDNLCFYIPDAGLFLQDKSGNIRRLKQGTFKQITILRNQLVVVSPSDISFFDANFNPITLTMAVNYIDCRNANNTYWLAKGEEGISGIKKNPNTADYEPILSGLLVNSPFRNYTFNLRFTDGKLLVTGGAREGGRANIPGTFMVLENGKWTNFDDKEISAQTGLQCRDFMSAVVDPRDPTRYFVASWGTGLYEFKNNKFVQLYALKNSPLESMLGDPYTLDVRSTFVMIDDLDFDRYNNLYMLNTEVDKAVVVLGQDNRWKSLSLPSIAKSRMRHLLITRDNKKWITIFREEEVGVFTFDDSNPSDIKQYHANSFTDQQGRAVGAQRYFAVAEDLNGLVWVGTDNGPISFHSQEQVRDRVCNRMVGTDQYGSNFYIMEGLQVNAIAVDGGNRKWMGTLGNGLFMVDNSTSPITVENYNTQNSHILSDNVNAIAINDKTGEVFVATDNGLCSYMGGAPTGKPDFSDVHAFPNPVHPARNNQVTITGLMQNSNIKITDVAGNLIQEGLSTGGQYTWNCSNWRGEIVKAGIYLVFAANRDGTQGVVTKIMVIK
jgi:hypothetical protein